MSRVTKSRRPTNGALFQVFQGEEADTKPDKKHHATGSKRPQKVPQKRRVLSEDKENAPQAIKLNGPKSKQTAKDLFSGKVPFDLASPVACNDESKSQKLGYYAESPSASSALANKSSKSNQASQPVHLGDPVKKPAKTVSRRRLGSDELLNLPKATEQGTPAKLWLDAASQMSPVLANVTEAYTGQNGFHYSPAAEHVALAPVPTKKATDMSTQEKSTTIESPDKNVAKDVFNVDKDVAKDVFIVDPSSHQDSPCEKTAVLTGSPIKRSRPQRPLQLKNPTPLRL